MLDEYSSHSIRLQCCDYHLYPKQNAADYYTTLQVTRLLTLARVLREIVESKLVDQTNGHTSMLKHVVERQILDRVVGSVDMRVRVLESRLNDEGGGVSGLGGRSVVGAGVAALGLDPGDVAVLE